MWCWCGKNHYLVSKKCSKQNNWNNDLLKVKSHCKGIMQTKWHWCCMLMTLDRSICSRNIQWLVKTSLLKKILCRGIWLCQLTYPAIYRQTMNKSDLWQTSTIVIIYRSNGLQSHQNGQAFMKWHGHCP